VVRIRTAGPPPEVIDRLGRAAREAVASGKALAKLSQFVACTQRFKPAA
jgi:hypothetical protein